MTFIAARLVHSTATAERQKADQRHQAGHKRHLGIRVGPIDPPANRLLGERGRRPGEETQRPRDLPHPLCRQFLAEGVIDGELTQRAEPDHEQRDTGSSHDAGKKAATMHRLVNSEQARNVAIRAPCTDTPRVVSHLIRKPIARQPTSVAT